MLGRDSILWGRPSDPGDSPRRSILHCVRMLAPFQEALPECPYLPSDVAEGERQFYAFLHGVYDEMYGDPGFFLVPETEYDAYMASPARREWEEKHAGLSEEGHAPVDQKESRLRNQFQQAIRFYSAYLYELGMRGKVSEEGVLELTLSAWREARSAMEWPHLREGNEERFQRLQALGLGLSQGKGSVRVVNRDFPKMMFGLWVLCAAPKTPFHRTDYLRLDYAGALRGGPVLEDVFQALDPGRASLARQFHQVGEDAGLKGKIRPLREITSGSCWKVEYTWEGRAAAALYAEPGRLVLGIHLGPAERAMQQVEELRGMNPSLAQWLEAHLEKRWEPKPGGEALRVHVVDPAPQDVRQLRDLLQLPWKWNGEQEREV